ncbi:MAG: hypothetical protein ACI3XZ_01035 [Butyricicoccus sp.]
MKLKAFTPFVVGLAALAGAVLRGLNLLHGYEQGTCLPMHGDPGETGLIVLTAAAALFLLFAAIQFRKNRGMAFETAFSGGDTIFKMLSVIAGLVMLAAGAFGLYLTVSGNTAPLAHPEAILMVQPSPLSNLPMIPLWILAMLTGGCFIGIATALSRKTITESTAALTIVPMFWACFDLIITFKDNGASPFVGLYGFELLAAIFLTYAFYSLAGFLYSTASPSRFVFSAGLAAILCTACVGGAIIALAAGATAVTFTMQTLLRYACFLASGVWMFTLLVLLARSTAGEAVPTEET